MNRTRSPWNHMADLLDLAERRGDWRKARVWQPVDIRDARQRNEYVRQERIGEAYVETDGLPWDERKEYSALRPISELRLGPRRGRP